MVNKNKGFEGSYICEEGSPAAIELKRVLEDLQNYVTLIYEHSNFKMTPQAINARIDGILKTLIKPKKEKKSVEKK